MQAISFWCFLFIFLGHFRQATSSPVPDYAQYYGYRNRAKMALIRSQFPQADSLYRKAFEHAAGKPFQMDVLFAAISAIKNKDTSGTISLLRLFANRGGNLKSINAEHYDNPVIKSGFEMVSGLIKKRQLKQELKSSYKVHRKKLDRRLTRKINRFFFWDQFYARTVVHGIFPKGKRWKVIQKVDSIHFVKLKKIALEKKKWIGFESIGEGENREDWGLPYLSKFDVLMRHWKVAWHLSIDSLVLNSIKELDFYPATWAGHLDYASFGENMRRLNQTTTETFVPYGTFKGPGGKKLLAHNGVDRANQMRKRLFLLSIEDYAECEGLSVNQARRDTLAW